MIIETLLNTILYVYGSGNACKLLGPALPEPVTPDVPGFCICDFILCDYAEKVFADPASSDWWKNDENEFLFKRMVAADTVDMELWLNEVKVADLNTTNEGTYFNGFPLGTAEQQLYKGYLLNWKLIEALYGVGRYQVKVNLNILGVASVFESRYFHLCIYNILQANETVRIETVQNGNIIGNQFDFTGLDWYGSVRVPGVFGNPQPIFEDKSYVTEERKKAQIQSKMSREFELVTKAIKYEVANVLIYNKMLANSIKITDYAIKAENTWRRVDVRPKELSKRPTKGNPNKLYNITFVDERDYFLKRNF